MYHTKFHDKKKTQNSHLLDMEITKRKILVLNIFFVWFLKVFFLYCCYVWLYLVFYKEIITNIAAPQYLTCLLKKKEKIFISI